MERERYVIHQEATEIAGNFADRMQWAETLALHLADDITNAREGLLQEERMFGKTQLGYNQRMDAVSYQVLSAYQSIDPLGSLVHQKALEALNAFTSFQLETHLSERFNVLLSTYRLDIRDGEIWSERMQEPFKNMLIRGQKYREHHGSLEVEREKAEVDSFVDGLEPLLCDPRTPVNTILLSFSPRGKPGSIYQHNFYDMFILRQEESGKRYVEVKRYSSGLTLQEYTPIVLELNPMLEIPENADDVFWKKQYVRVMNSMYNTPEKLHAFLHKEHTYMSEKEFAFIKNGVGPYEEMYTKILSENPYDWENQNLAYRAVLNKADQLWGVINGTSEGSAYPIYNSQADYMPSIDYIRLLGSQHVRQVMTGCGISGDEKKQDMLKDPIEQMLEDLFGRLFKAADGVFDFGEEEWFKCPSCHYQATGPIGNMCPGCHITKEDYAKNSGQKVCA